MISVSIARVVIKNFRSFKDETFTPSANFGLKFLGGENQIQPRLGANGTGKSSLWEAVEWCFHGTSIRGARTSSVISWGEKEVEVVTDVLVNGQLNVIRRSGPPTKLELNGTPVEQKDVDLLLHLSKQRFLHSVVFGQGMALFPDLPIPERGNLLDEVLNLDLWSKCTETASSKHRLLEVNLSEMKQQTSFIKGQMTGLQTDETIQKQIDEWDLEWLNTHQSLEKQQKEWETGRQTAIQSLEQEAAKRKKEKIDELQGKNIAVGKLHVDMLALEGEVKPTASLAQDVKLARQLITSLEQELASVQKTSNISEARRTELQPLKTFWEMNTTCPTCSQSITDTLKSKQISDLTSNIAVLNSSFETASTRETAIKQDIRAARLNLSSLENQQATEVERSRNQQRAIRTAKSSIDDLEREIVELSRKVNENPFATNITTLKNQINPIPEQLQLHDKKENPFIAVLVDTQRQRIALELQLDLIEIDIKHIEALLVAAEYWKHGFKRIRLFFVKRILTALEIEIASAISSLGLEGWVVNLATEVETKSGTMKLGVQIHIKDPKGNEGTWETWSGGESQRLRIAMAMGLASLIQRAAGVVYELEVWDEPTAFLSGEGIEDLLQTLQYRAESQKKQIWISDHKALTFSGFSEIWTVVKDTNGSKVYCTNRMEAA